VRVEDAHLINTSLASQTTSVAGRMFGAIIAGQSHVVEDDVGEGMGEAQSQAEGK
jgi:hypothetical protein